jgi:hypothetical protein
MELSDAMRLVESLSKQVRELGTELANVNRNVTEVQRRIGDLEVFSANLAKKK